VTKVTFTLDDETVRTIRTMAERRRKPQSLVVREAVAAYAAQEEKLDDAERARRLRVLDELATKPRTRSQRDVDQELREIRLGRRAGRPTDGPSTLNEGQIAERGARIGKARRPRIPGVFEGAATGGDDRALAAVYAPSSSGKEEVRVSDPLNG
jgi:hypothetical protein